MVRTPRQPPKARLREQIPHAPMAAIGMTAVPGFLAVQESALARAFPGA